jgi:hypothetical protein
VRIGGIGSELDCISVRTDAEVRHVYQFILPLRVRPWYYFRSVLNLSPQRTIDWVRNECASRPSPFTARVGRGRFS